MNSLLLHLCNTDKRQQLIGQIYMHEAYWGVLRVERYPPKDMLKS